MTEEIPIIGGRYSPPLVQMRAYNCLCAQGWKPNHQRPQKLVVSHLIIGNLERVGEILA
jgi:hypothetical protein